MTESWQSPYSPLCDCRNFSVEKGTLASLRIPACSVSYASSSLFPWLWETSGPSLGWSSSLFGPVRQSSWLRLVAGSTDAPLVSSSPILRTHARDGTKQRKKKKESGMEGYIKRDIKCCKQKYKSMRAHSSCGSRRVHSQVHRWRQHTQNS